MPEVNQDLLIVLQTIGVGLIGVFQYYQSKTSSKTNTLVNEEVVKGNADRKVIEDTVIMSAQKLDNLYDKIHSLEVQIEEVNRRLAKFVK